MKKHDYQLNDIVELKKPHPCGSRLWRVIRMGMDIRIKCTGCQHSVLLPRAKFEKGLKKVISSHTEQDGSKD